MKHVIISSIIRDYRRRHKLTQAQFGDAIGVSPQAISKWERQECYPDITFLPRLADLLGCTVNDFFA